MLAQRPAVLRSHQGLRLVSGNCSKRLPSIGSHLAVQTARRQPLGLQSRREQSRLGPFAATEAGSSKLKSGANKLQNCASSQDSQVTSGKTCCNRGSTNSKANLSKLSLSLSVSVAFPRLTSPTNSGISSCRKDEKRVRTRKSTPLNVGGPFPSPNLATLVGSEALSAQASSPITTTAASAVATTITPTTASSGHIQARSKVPVFTQSQTSALNLNPATPSGPLVSQEAHSLVANRSSLIARRSVAARRSDFGGSCNDVNSSSFRRLVSSNLQHSSCRSSQTARNASSLTCLGPRSSFGGRSGGACNCKTNSINSSNQLLRQGALYARRHSNQIIHHRPCYSITTPASSISINSRSNSRSNSLHNSSSALLASSRILTARNVRLSSQQRESKFNSSQVAVSVTTVRNQGGSPTLLANKTACLSRARKLSSRALTSCQRGQPNIGLRSSSSSSSSLSLQVPIQVKRPKQVFESPARLANKQREQICGRVSGSWKFAARARATGASAPVSSKQFRPVARRATSTGSSEHSSTTSSASSQSDSTNSGSQRACTGNRGRRVSNAHALFLVNGDDVDPLEIQGNQNQQQLQEADLKRKQHNKFNKEPHSETRQQSLLNSSKATTTTEDIPAIESDPSGQNNCKQSTKNQNYCKMISQDNRNVVATVNNPICEQAVPLISQKLVTNLNGNNTNLHIEPTENITTTATMPTPAIKSLESASLRNGRALSHVNNNNNNNEEQENHSPKQTKLLAQQAPPIPLGPSRAANIDDSSAKCQIVDQVVSSQDRCASNRDADRNSLSERCHTIPKQQESPSSPSFLENDKQIHLNQSTDHQSDEHMVLGSPLATPPPSDLDDDQLESVPKIPIKVEPISDCYDMELRPFARGKFAQVKRCIQHSTKRCFAAKCIKKRRRLVDIRHEILLEIEVLKFSYNCDHIIKIFDVYDTSSEMILILEMAEGGELQRVLDDEEKIGETIVKQMTGQILEGLVCLHDHDIAHLDLKPQNILLKSHFPQVNIKLCDFGMSRRINKDLEVREICGTPDYVAPEILRYDPISLTTDMWSLGVLTYVLLSGYSPFGGDTKQQTFCNITQAKLDFPGEIFDQISPEALDFMQKIILREPSARLTSRQARDHPWPC